MDERRNSERIDAYQVGLAAVNDVDGAQLGVIGNLSLGGMMLIANQQLQAEGILQLKMNCWLMLKVYWELKRAPFLAK